MDGGKLIEAIKQNDVDRARLLATDQQLRRHGVNSVLELAVDLGQTDSVRALLTDYLRPENDSLNPESASRALRLACRLPEEDTALCMATALLEHGAGCHQGDGARCERWGPSLLVAANRGHARVIRLLVEHCKAVDCSNQKDVLFEGAALDHAAFYGHKEVVELLLKYGARLDQERGVQNPLASAARHGHSAIIRLLCEGGAPTDEAKGLALLEAAKHDQSEAVDTLCRLGADPSFTSGSDAPLLITVPNRHEDMINALCSRNVDVDHVMTMSTSLMPYLQTSALHQAASKGHTDVIKAICANGADVNLIAENRTPLFEAAANCQVDAIDVLCANGANVDLATTADMPELYPGRFSTDEGATALMMACKRGHLQAVIHLLENGCNVNLKDRRGNTALYFCFHPSENRKPFSKDPTTVQTRVSRRWGTFREAYSLFCSPMNFGLSRCECGLYRLKIVQLLVKAGCTLSPTDDDYFDLFVQHVPTACPTVRNELFKCLKLMLLAGWPVTQSTSQLMSRPDIKEELMANCVFDYVTRPHDNPPSLQNLCKFVIRKELRTPLERHLADTGLPPRLQEFVLCSRYGGQKQFESLDSK